MQTVKIQGLRGGEAGQIYYAHLNPDGPGTDPDLIYVVTDHWVGPIGIDRHTGISSGKGFRVSSEDFDLLNFLDNVRKNAINVINQIASIKAIENTVDFVLTDARANTAIVMLQTMFGWTYDDAQRFVSKRQKIVCESKN